MLLRIVMTYQLGPERFRFAEISAILTSKVFPQLSLIISLIEAICIMRKMACTIAKELLLHKTNIHCPRKTIFPIVVQTQNH
jgi:hypothetical protein